MRWRKDFEKAPINFLVSFVGKKYLARRKNGERLDIYDDKQKFWILDINFIELDGWHHIDGWMPIPKEINKKRWRKDFENIPKGDFIASYKGKSCFAVKETPKAKRINISPQKYTHWIYGFDFSEIDGWMPMPEGIKKEK